jgi:hypothetical protein
MTLPPERTAGSSPSVPEGEGEKEAETQIKAGVTVPLRVGNDVGALAAELKRWERFALRRVKAGRDLRPFKSTAIPASLYVQIDAALREARTVEDVFATFGEALEAVGGAVRQKEKEAA